MSHDFYTCNLRIFVYDYFCLASTTLISADKRLTNYFMTVLFLMYHLFTFLIWNCTTTKLHKSSHTHSLKILNNWWNKHSLELRCTKTKLKAHIYTVWKYWTIYQSSYYVYKLVDTRIYKQPSNELIKYDKNGVPTAMSL